MCFIPVKVLYKQRKRLSIQSRELYMKSHILRKEKSDGRDSAPLAFVCARPSFVLLRLSFTGNKSNEFSAKALEQSNCLFAWKHDPYPYSRSDAAPGKRVCWQPVSVEWTVSTESLGTWEIYEMRHGIFLMEQKLADLAALSLYDWWSDTPY